MSKVVDVVIAIAIVVVLGAVLFMTSSGPPSQNAVLYGVVKIGPICPVQMENIPCSTPPEVYQARKVVILSSDTKTVVRTVSLDDNGNYSTELPAGTYVIDINYVGMDRSPEVPRTVILAPGENLILDINIDTGIR